MSFLLDFPSYISRRFAQRLALQAKETVKVLIMKEGIPKISVLIITYNQEDVIKRTVESLIEQKDYIYEICISDDCSKDKTWDILLYYSREYPGLFVLNRNNPNIGIFQNVEKSWTMPSGDLVYQMAGDDECGNGWFQKVVEFIEEKQIDYKNDLFCIYGDYKAVYPNGDNVRVSNSYVQNMNIPPFSMALRHLIENRSTCFSSGVLKKFKYVSQGRSHMAEEIQSRQIQMFSKNNYYIHHTGNIYYTNIGVSAHINESTHNERQKLADYTIQKATEMGYEIDEKDKNYMYFTKALFQAKYTNKFSDYYKAFVYYIKSYDPKVGLKGLRFKRIVFAIIRRLPHKKPISMTI